MAAMAELTRQEASRKDSRRRPPRRVPTTVVRIVLVGAMCEVLAIVAGRAFDDLVWPLLAAPPVVTGAGLLCYRRRAIERAGVLAAGIVVGTLLAGLLTGAGPTDLLTGPFTGVKRLLTAEWPSPRRSADRGRGRLDARARDRRRGRARRTSAAAPRATGGGDRRLHRRDGDLGTGPPDAGHVVGARSHGAGADDAATRRRRPRHERARLAATARCSSCSPPSSSPRRSCRAPSRGRIVPTRVRRNAAEATATLARPGRGDGRASRSQPSRSTSSASPTDRR